MIQPVAIQSWCYRHFKALPDFFAQLNATTVNATELCGVHANFNDPTTWRSTIDAFQTADVKIVAIGVENMTGDPAKDASKFEFCALARVPNMSITFGPELLDNNCADMKKVEALAQKHNIKIGIHNHGGYDWLGSDRILKYIFDRSTHIGLHMDTAWAIDAKQDPCKWAEQFKSKLTGLHVKDFLYSEKRQPRDVVIGTGILDLPKLIGQLKSMNFAGPIVIEYEGDETNPVPALKDCVQHLRSLL